MSRRSSGCHSDCCAPWPLAGARGEVACKVRRGLDAPPSALPRASACASRPDEATQRLVPSVPCRLARGRGQGLRLHQAVPPQGSTGVRCPGCWAPRPPPTSRRSAGCHSDCSAPRLLARAQGEVACEVGRGLDVSSGLPRAQQLLAEGVPCSLARGCSRGRHVHRAELPQGSTGLRCPDWAPQLLPDGLPAGDLTAVGKGGRRLVQTLLAGRSPPRRSARPTSLLPGGGAAGYCNCQIPTWQCSRSKNSTRPERLRWRASNHL